MKRNVAEEKRRPDAAFVPNGGIVLPAMDEEQQRELVESFISHGRPVESGTLENDELMDLTEKIELIAAHMEARRKITGFLDVHEQADPELQSLKQTGDRLGEELRRRGDLLLNEILVENPDAVRVFLNRAVGNPEYRTTRVMEMGVQELAEELGGIVKATDDETSPYHGGYMQLLRLIISLDVSLRAPSE